MATIDKANFTRIGFVAKPHGLKGELMIEVNVGSDSPIDETDHLMLEIDGGLVPFFVADDGIRFRNSTSMSVSFDDVDTIEKARTLSGCQVWIDSAYLEEEVEGDEMDTLTGFKVIDLTKGDLGKVERMDDFSGNVVITIRYQSKEILVPLADEMIVSCDMEKQVLTLDCPEGLIDLYL